MSEIWFVLPEEEAIQISCFEDFFEDSSFLMTGQGKRISLTLSCIFKDSLLKKIGNIKTQIRCELWKAQCHDFYLRNYLQNHPKGERLLYDMPEAAPQAPKGNIIPFRQHKND
jgi:hypothetical protein